MATTEGETVGQRQLKLHQLRFAAKDLRKMPERERVFTMLLAHIANEINILQKLIMMAHNFDDEPEPWETQGRTAQTMCLLRVLVGKLNEAHRTVQKRYVKTGLHTQLEADLNEQPRTCFEHFMNYFDMPCNNINVLRKKVAFHNDWEFARKNIDSLPNDVPLFIYTDETVGKLYSTLLISAFRG